MKPGAVTYTEELADEICERLAKGETLRAICRDKHMPSEAAVRKWSLDESRPFSAHYARAREAGYRTMADELLEIADKGDLEPMDRRVRIDTRKWLLSKALPKVYGDKLELSGNDDSPLTIQVINYAQSANPDTTE